jgi:hypothetical protein
MTNEAVLIQVDDGKLFAAADPDRLEAVFGEYQSISDRANRLLSRQEDFYVAFKRSISGLESDDLVSFANSKKGGAILIGVNRTTHGNGRERVALVGCTVGDREQLRILAKASQCVPPVPVSIFVENRAEKPFYRIEVPSGPHKPYCTSGGTYKTRGDGRNEMLYPAEILRYFGKWKAGSCLGGSSKRQPALAPPRRRASRAASGNRWKHLRKPLAMERVTLRISSPSQKGRLSAASA